MIRNQKNSPSKTALARRFRRVMTFAEKCFWNACRNHRIGGLHFRRQQIIKGFIADFYCSDFNLVVEIDGAAHQTQEEYDQERDRIMRQHGIRVIRFSNDDVVNHMDTVIRRILSDPTLPSPRGEGNSEQE